MKLGINLGIIGMGFVGNAVLQNINKGVKVFAHDSIKEKSQNTLSEVVDKSDFIFCCLPTIQNEDDTQNFEAYHNLFKGLEQFNMEDKVLIIKSTVLYSNIKPYLNKYKIVLNPEFLNANNAVDDFSKQKNLILGGNPLDTKRVSDMYEECFNLDLVSTDYLSFEESINVKYIHNIYHSYKILFWNYVHEVTDNPRLYSTIYKKLRNGMDNEMSQISPDGKMGYGGACFPKDVAAFGIEHEHEMVQYMKDFNKRIRD